MNDDNLQGLPGSPTSNETADASGGDTETITTPETMGFMEILYGVITKPTATLRYIADTKPVFIGIVLYLAISWIASISAIPGLMNSFKTMPPEAASMPLFNPRVMALFIIIATPVLSTIGLFITSGIYHLVATLLRGKGEFGGLLSVIGFSNFPALLTTPFALLNFLVGRFGAFSPMDLLIVSIHGLISFGIGIWVLVLEIIGIRENYRFSTGRAVATVFVPIVVALILGIIIAFLLVAVIIGAAGSLSSATN